MKYNIKNFILSRIDIIEENVLSITSTDEETEIVTLIDKIKGVIKDES